MAKPEITPYGSWKSPITSDLIVAETIRLGQIELDGETIYWIEQRPSEGGRNVVVRRAPGGTNEDVTPPPFNARTRVHEYGGGAYLVHDGTVYLSNFDDQRLYRQDPGGKPHALTPSLDLRYADGVVDPGRGRLIMVREDHTVEGREALNTLVSVSMEGDDKGGQVLVSGNDFYSSPRLNPDGSRLAWLTWNHPNMPWDGTELWLAGLGEDGSVVDAHRVAGGHDESIFQPEWSPQGDLYFVSDRSGWWNIYRLRQGNIEPIHPMEGEFGQPQWQFGQSAYDFQPDGAIVCAYTEKSLTYLASLDTATGKLQQIQVPYTDIEEVRCLPGRVVMNAGSPTEPWSLVQLDLASRQPQIIRRESEFSIESCYLSIPQAIEFPTEGGKTAHGLFYEPENCDHVGPDRELPPLIVMVHGGPTGSAFSTLNLSIQFWTSRGFAVLDVNYGGSTGYGREYRRRLNGQWGVVDVDDCVNGARYLIDKGLVDGKRVAIRGGSAGGYTTLNALTFRDLFRAGASYYGISDLQVFVHDTHKFESRYLDRLVGPYPEREDLYRERSAINYTDRLSSPMILFQGLEDKIVPPNQAELMVEALRAKGLPVAYLPFEGEQHGFRRAENIKRSLDAELYFYSKIFGFALPEPVEPVEIENLPES